MRLKIDDLEKIAGEVMNAETETKALREEIVRVLGHRVVMAAPIGRVAADACQVIDADEMSGLRSPASKFDKGLMLRYVGHGDPHVRKLAARIVPVKHLTRMLDDRSSLVRAEAAKRAGMELVSEALNRHPDDDGLYDTYASRLLCEDGIKQPKVTDDEPLDIHGDEPLGDAVKQQPGPELSDTWYKNRAFEFMQDYGTNIEYAWEETLVKIYCDAYHTTSGVEIDRVRLLKAIKDLIKEKEDRALERDSLKEAKLSARNIMAKCRMCGKLTHSNVQGAGLDLCNKCFEQAGLENEHADGMHDAQPDPDCEWCDEERAEGLKEAVTRRLKNPSRVLRPKRQGGSPLPQSLVTDDDVMKALKMWPDSGFSCMESFCDSFFGGAQHPDWSDKDFQRASDELYARLDDLDNGLDEADFDDENPSCPKCGKMLSGTPGALKCVGPGHCGFDQQDMLAEGDEDFDSEIDFGVNGRYGLQHAWANKDPHKCGCLGDGWFVERDDSEHKCPYHYTDQPGPVYLTRRMAESANCDADDYYVTTSGDIPQCPRCGMMLSGSPGCLKCNEPGHCDYDQQKMVPHDLDEAIDLVSSLTPHLGTQEFIELAEQVFSIKKSTVPSGVRKHRLGEGNSRPNDVPVVGRLPENRTSFTSADERALDEFCRRWSKQQASVGEPFALGWDPHPDAAGKVGFRLELF